MKRLMIMMAAVLMTAGLNAMADDIQYTLPRALVALTNSFEVMEWEQLAKDQDEEACFAFVKEHEMITIPAGTIVFASDNFFGFKEFRIKGTTNKYYIPLHKTESVYKQD